MKKLTKEQLDVIMRRYLAFCVTLEINYSLSNEKAQLIERAFVLGAASAILDIETAAITIDMMPAVVGMCWMAGRPLATVGNWDQKDTRLAGASKTW